MDGTLLLLVVLAVLLLIAAGWQMLRTRSDIHSPRDVVDLIRHRIDHMRAPQWPPQRQAEPWYRRSDRLRALIVALVGVLVLALLAIGGAEFLGRSPVDRFVVRVAMFNVAGQDERQGRLLAEQLVDALRAGVRTTMDLATIDELVVAPDQALALAQEQQVDVLIWGEALEGVVATQDGLRPRLVWRTDQPFAPRTWPGFDGRFAVPTVYDLAPQSLNGAVVLPPLLDSINSFSHGDITAADAHADALLRGYTGTLNAELPLMLRMFGNWATGLYADAEAEARATLAAADRPEHWNNLGVILHERGEPSAEAAFRQALAPTPGFAIAHANLGRWLLDNERPMEALASARTAVQLAPDSRPLQALLGAAQRASGLLEEARNTFTTIAQNDRDNMVARTQLAVLSLTDVATATGRLEWELERPPVRSEDQLVEARDEIQRGISRLEAQRADYLQQGNAHGVAGRIVEQRLSEQIAARLQTAIYAHSYDLLLVQIEAGRIEAARERGMLARLWDGLRGRRTRLEEARLRANALRDRLPAQQYDLLYQAGRAAYYGNNLEAAQRSWDEAQALADNAPPDTPLHSRPEARYGQALLSLAASDRAVARERFNAALAADGRFFPAHAQLAMLAEQEGQWAEAATHYRWLAEQRPFDPVGPLGMARMLRAQGNLVEAETYLIPFANAGNADALIALGTLYRAADRLDDAERILQRAFEVAPGRADLHEERAAVALARGDVAAAEVALKQAIRLDEQRTSAYITLGRLYAERLDRPEEAAEQLRAAARIEPNNPDAQRWLAEALLQLNEPSAAVTSFNRALDVAPNDYAARHGLAQAYLAQDRLEDAAQAEQRALDDSNGTFVPALIGLGDIAQRLGRPDEARERYAAALAQDNTATDAYLGLGRLAAAQGDQRTALSYYQQGLSVHPQSVRLLLARGDLLSQSGDVNGALEAYNQARQAAPNNPVVHARMGRALWQAGQDDAALTELDLALRLNPNDADSLLLIGEIAEQQQRFDAALEAYERAVRVRSDWHEPHYRRGTLLLRLQRTDEAIRDLERSVRLEPDFAQGAYWLGRAYRAAERPRDAERMFRRAIELLPSYYEARFFLGQTLVDLGQPTEAHDVYQSILAETPPTDPWHVEAQQALGNR